MSVVHATHARGEGAMCGARVRFSWETTTTYATCKRCCAMLRRMGGKRKRMPNGRLSGWFFPREEK